MNIVQGSINRALANKHTTGAAGIFVLVAIVSKVGAVWFPTHAAQFEQTADLIKDGAIAYGFIMSGDSQPSNQVDTPPAGGQDPKP